MPQASIKQLKDGNLGDVTEERVSPKQNNVVSHKTRFIVICAQQVYQHEGETHSDNLQRIHDVPEGYYASIAQISRNNRVWVPDEIVDLLKRDVPENHTEEADREKVKLH